MLRYPNTTVSKYYSMVSGGCVATGKYHEASTLAQTPLSGVLSIFIVISDVSVAYRNGSKDEKTCQSKTLMKCMQTAQIQGLLTEKMRDDRIKVICVTIHISEMKSEEIRLMIKQYHTTQQYILGIDQGGTKTAAALMNQNGEICGVGMAAGAYFPEQGMEIAIFNMLEAAEIALEKAHTDWMDVGVILAGVSGVDWDGDGEQVARALKNAVMFRQEQIAQESTNIRVQIYNDSLIALYGGTKHACGAVICAGTGINAAIRKKDGSYFVFGDFLGEEMQGGSALAQRAVRKVFDAELGLCDAKALRKLFLDFAGVDSVQDLLKQYIQQEELRANLKQVVPGLFQLAEEGDETSRLVLREFAEQLNMYILAGLRKEEMLQESFDMVLTGGVFKGENNLLTTYVREGLEKEVPHVTIQQAKYEPVVGACVMAMLEQRELTPQMAEHLKKTAEKWGLKRALSS